MQNPTSHNDWWDLFYFFFYFLLKDRDRSILKPLFINFKDAGFTVPPESPQPCRSVHLSICISHIIQSIRSPLSNFMPFGFIPSFTYMRNWSLPKLRLTRNNSKLPQDRLYAGPPSDQNFRFFGTGGIEIWQCFFSNLGQILDNFAFPHWFPLMFYSSS